MIFKNIGCLSVDIAVGKHCLRRHSLTLVQTIILPIVLYGCETWSLTLREERRVTVFENRVLRRIFGRRRDEITGE